LIAESRHLENNDYISGIHHFSHKGQTRIIWKPENDSRSWARIEDVSKKRREGKRKHQEWKRDEVEEMERMDVNRSGEVGWREKRCSECYRGKRWSRKGRS